MRISDGASLEQSLLRFLRKNTYHASTRAIFILGAPRTGSTILYQALCSRFELPYIANLTNEHYPDTPILGLAIQKSFPVQILFSSRYGKTDGPLQPSEGSAVMAHWFGGGHPSALVSNSIKEGMQEHFLATLGTAESLFGRPLVIKNPWNCFRVRCLAETVPAAQFIWIRRNLAAASKSDLAARYKTKGSPTLWNSATPANLKKLQRLPPAVQVVENQHEFNRAIDKGLNTYAAGRWTEIWYEDFCCDPNGVLNAIARALSLPSSANRTTIKLTSSRGWELAPAEEAAIDDYASHRDHCRES